MIQLSKAFYMPLLFSLAGYVTYAQSNEPYIYGELGGGDGTHNTYKAALNTIFGAHNVISLSYYYSLHRAPNIPADYNANGLFGTIWPEQTVSAFGLSYGYAFFLNSPLIRFIIKGGLAAGKVQTPVNFVLVYSGGWGSGYSYSIEKQFILGIVFDPSVEFPLGRGFGFSVGPYANINPIKPVFGLDAGIIFGKVRGRRNNHSIHRANEY